MTTTFDSATDTANANFVTQHQGEYGALWTNHPDFTSGSAVLNSAGTAVRQVGVAQFTAYASGAPGTADYGMRFTTTIKSAAGTAFLLARSNTSVNSQWYNMYLEPANSRVTLYRNVGGAATQLAQQTGITFTTGDIWEIRTTGTGATVTIVILQNGVQRISFGDTNGARITTAGVPAFGLGGNGSDTTQVHVSNIEVFAIGTLEMPYNQPRHVTLGSTGNTIVISDAAASWTPGTPGSPTFTISGAASITSQVVNSSTQATLTISAGNTIGNVTITDPGSGKTVVLGVVPTAPVQKTAADPIIAAGLSPGNWWLSTNKMRTTYMGAYLRYAFNIPTGSDAGYVRMAVDVSAMSALSAGSYPTVSYSVDGGAWTDTQLTSSTVVINMGTGLAVGNHTLNVIFRRIDYSSSGCNNWNGAIALRMDAITLPGSSTSITQYSDTLLYSQKALVFADSIGAGVKITSTAVPGGGDATIGVVEVLRDTLAAEIGMLGMPGLGVLQTPNTPSTAPVFWNASTGSSSRTYKWLDSSNALDTSIAYDFIINMLGTNDQIAGVPSNPASVTSAWTAWMNDVRSTWPNALIISVLMPCTVGSSNAIKNAITAGFNAYSGGNARLIDATIVGNSLQGPIGSAGRLSTDMVHPNAEGAQAIGGIIGNGSIITQSGVSGGSYAFAF